MIYITPCFSLQSGEFAPMGGGLKSIGKPTRVFDTNAFGQLIELNEDQWSMNSGEHETFELTNYPYGAIYAEYGGSQEIEDRT